MYVGREAVKASPSKDTLMAGAAREPLTEMSVASVGTTTVASGGSPVVPFGRKWRVRDAESKKNSFGASSSSATFSTNHSPPAWLPSPPWWPPAEKRHASPLDHGPRPLVTRGCDTSCHDSSSRP
jgi:hypothetical protein